MQEFENSEDVPYNFTGKFRLKSTGNIIHCVKGIPHRLDGPAIEWFDGYKVWYKKGLRHRLDGPAVEYPDGYKLFFVEGQEYSEEKFNSLHEVVLRKAGLQMFL